MIATSAAPVAAAFSNSLRATSFGLRLHAATPDHRGHEQRHADELRERPATERWSGGAAHAPDTGIPSSIMKIAHAPVESEWW